MTVGLLGLLGNTYFNNKATSAINQGNEKAIGTIEGYYGQAKDNFAPYMQMGQNGLSGLSRLMQDPSSIRDNPAYQWRFDQGMDMHDRSAAANGRLFSGGHERDLMAYGQGLASQEYGNEWDRMFGLAGMGQQSAGQLGALGQMAGKSIADLYGDMGKNRASSYVARGSNLNDMLGNAAASIFKMLGY